MPDDQLRYGLIGAGGFGKFCIEQYCSMPGLIIAAVADANRDAAKATATHFSAEPFKLNMHAYETVDALLADSSIDLVHIATPPFTHADLAAKALTAGKHVLCEKPLATTIEDGRKLAALAAEHRRVLSVNLIMRYNPLAEAVKAICEQRLLGEPLHGYFENYAKDEQLGPDHWFWQREHSGGIFIEHGVHFFDLFDWWLAPSEGRNHTKVVSSHQVVRPGTNDLVEQQQCTVRYGEGSGSPLVNFYHGFTQAERMDRQEIRLLFERGDIRLHEWVPTRIEIDGLMTTHARESIAALLHHPEVVSIAEVRGDERHVYSRHKRYEIDGRYRITASVGVNGEALDKPALYGHVLRGLLGDQLQAIRALARGEPHDRRISEANGLSSLELAARAQAQAEQSA